MGILSFLFGKSKKLPYSKNIRFKRVYSEYQVDIGDSPKIWNKPNSNQINLYTQGSVSGEGLIAKTINPVISHHLKNKNYLLIKTNVTSVTDKYIQLQIDMTLESLEDKKTKWIDKLKKKYTPRNSWQLRFYSKQEITKSNLIVNTICSDQLSNFYDNVYQSIWLADLNGIKIQAENLSLKGDIEKTLRATFSGHTVIVSNLKNNGDMYNLEIIIKE